MKLNALLFALLVLGVSTPVFAGKKPKGLPPTPVASASTVMTKYDKNGNGVLDDTEKEAIRSALGRDPDLTRFDTNSDGKLDEAELAAIAKPSASAAEEPAKRKKKK